MNASFFHSANIESLGVDELDDEHSEEVLVAEDWEHAGSIAERRTLQVFD